MVDLASTNPRHGGTKMPRPRRTLPSAPAALPQIRPLPGRRAGHPPRAEPLALTASITAAALRTIRVDTAAFSLSPRARVLAVATEAGARVMLILSLSPRRPAPASC
jgi:hypothetical protein